MKKALSYVVVACLLLMSLSGMSFAATTYQPTISAEGGNVGDTITVTVSLPANTGATGGSFNLIYDNTKLELVDATAGTIISANNPTVNKTFAENKVRVNFAGLNAISANGGVALTATFKAIADGTAEFSTEKLKLADANTNYLTCSDASKSITIAKVDEVVFKPTITVDGESDVNVKVSLQPGTIAAGGSFNLIYDNTKLELVDAVAGSAVSANNPTINTNYSNKIRVNFAGLNAIPEDGGVALEVTFKAIADGEAVFEVENFKLADVDGNYLTCADVQTTANVKVDTTPVPVESVTLDKTSLTLTEGDSATLVATVLPAAATDKSVTWKTSDAKVATVVDGVVTAKAAGKATITVTTTDGKKTATCEVTVEENLEPTIVVSDVKGRAGETVEVTVSIKNNPGIVSMLLDVAYDSRYLSLASITNGSVLNGPLHDLGALNANPYTLSWGDDTATSNNTANGTIVTFAFKIADNAPIGSLPITVTYDNDNAAIFDKDFTLIDFGVINGSVEVRDFLLGDLDDNGKVNAFDRTILARYVANWDVSASFKAPLEAADVNADGNVNAFDRTILARHVANWDAYLTLPYKK